MLISVVIPTYNRCYSLKNTLISLKRQVIPNETDFNYEIIVIDNNSTDRTKEVIEDFMKEMGGRLKYLFESEKGTACARNKGIQEAKGKIIAFIDDDCTAADNWINDIAFTFNNYNADAVMGRISLILPNKKPEWIPDWFIKKRLAYIHYGDTTKRIDDMDLVGANMSFKAGIFKKFGGFNSVSEPCEDTRFSRMISKKGIVKFYCPTAQVFHWIPPERLTNKYFLKQSYRWGFVKYASPEEIKPRIRLLPWLLNELMKDIFTFAFKYLKGQKTGYFFALCNICDKAGIIHYIITSELLKPRRQKKL